ncbi:MAG: hypothetical protein ACYSU7_04570 [Planctomycetota bacterium]|jgi:hypothetical protein
MHCHSVIAAFALGTGLVAGGATADVIVQSGEIMQLGENEILLDQFDDQGGTRELNSVQIDLYSRIYGGFTTSGIGGNVRFKVTFDQDYSLDGHLLAGTQCQFADVLANDYVGAYSFLIDDTDQHVIAQPHKLIPWIGTDQITLNAFGDLVWDINPVEGMLDYVANLHADYTVTYDYTVLDCTADVNGDQVINVVDLLLVVGAFGNAGGPEDINNDGIVNVSDLLLVIGSWGPCPSDT